MGKEVAVLIAQRLRSLSLAMMVAFALAPAALVACFVAFAWRDYQSSLVRLTASGSAVCPDVACIAEMSGEYHSSFQLTAVFGSLAIVMAYMVVLGLVIFAIGMRESGFRVSFSPKLPRAP